jgi:bacteriorhodopsin
VFPRKKEVNEMYWLMGILGVFLIIAPFVLGYASNMMAMVSSVVLGALVVMVSIVKGVIHDMAGWEYWIAGILGLLAILAPFVLRFAQTGPLDVSVTLGAVIVVVAGYQLLTGHSQA